jgi:hypothetical protein
MSHSNIPADTVSWCENRDGELFLIYAERRDQQWILWERSTFEVRYYPMLSTGPRIARAEALLRARQTGGVAR